MRYQSQNLSACYKQHTFQELIGALKAGFNEADMKAWNLTPEEWTEQIQLAIRKKKLATLIALPDLPHAVFRLACRGYRSRAPYGAFQTRGIIFFNGSTRTQLSKR